MGIHYIEAAEVQCQRCKATILVRHWQDARQHNWAVPCDGNVQLCPDCVAACREDFKRKCKVSKAAEAEPVTTMGAAYKRGQQSVWQYLYSIAASHLKLPEAEKLAAQLTAERVEVVAYLRGVCEVEGDNAWEDDLHLQDVIEKHLMCHLVQLQ